MSAPGIPLQTVRRLPLYLRFFKEESSKGTEWVSSETLGDRLSLGAIQVRKDLSMIGAEGRARRGFPVIETIGILSWFLGSDDYADVFLIGSGTIADAVLADSTLERHGFKVIAVFDPNPLPAVGERFGRTVFPVQKFPDLVRRMGVKLAVFALSGPEGKDAALEAISASPLHGIYDLSGLELDFPPNILVEREDFGSRLAKLAGELGANRMR